MTSVPSDAAGSGDSGPILVAVVGTATEVGKTWVGARLAAAARRAGLGVAARKPVQSWAPGEGPTDAEVLAAATGEPVATVCPPANSLTVPMAPPMAAAVLGVECPGIGSLVEVARRWERHTDLVIVETVGGVRSPAAADGDSRDLLRALGPDAVLLVAHAGLGTVNDCLLAVEALAAAEPVIVLNRFDDADDLHARNRRWLSEREGLRVHAVGSPGWEAAVLADLGVELSPR